MDIFATGSAFPPSLRDHPIVTMCIIAAMWVGMLLCLQWLYAIIDETRGYPAGAKHPLTALRRVKALFVTAALVILLPRMLQVMAWERMHPASREAIALWTWYSFIPWAVLIGIAWWVDRYARAQQSFILQYFSIDDRPKDQDQEKIRGIIILALIFVTAFATTYIRPSDVSASQQHR